MYLNPKVRPSNYNIKIIDEPYNKISRQWRDRVKYWKKIYDLQGENGLKRQYRWHTYKEKLNVVKEVIKGNSINQVSINRNIPIKSIVDWVNLYRQKGISGLKLVNKRKVLMSKKEKKLIKRISLIYYKNHCRYGYISVNLELNKENLLLDSIVNSNTNKIQYTRNFSTDKPNQKWTTDVSEFRISSGKIYLSPILDMYDNSIISYDISTKANFEQTKRMLNKAF